MASAKEYSIQTLKALFQGRFSGKSKESEHQSAANEPSVVKIVVGLGNPGSKYRDTRHNVGFMVVDELTRRWSADRPKDRFRAQLYDAVIGSQRVILVKPQTFMNLSGAAVRQVVSWYRTDLEDVLIVTDDVDLPFGTLRMRERGSAGGHNGLKSIVSELGSQELPRLRIGIGRSDRAMSAHVLSRFSESEEKELESLITRAADGVELWLAEGAVAAMNVINQRPGEPAATSGLRGSEAP